MSHSRCINITDAQIIFLYQPYLLWKLAVAGVFTLSSDKTMAKGDWAELPIFTWFNDPD